jgi:hypothetical protein
MNIYHAWCDLKEGVSDIAFSEGVRNTWIICARKE